MALTYNPEIFSVPNLSQAKNIILTAESSTTEERWKTETPMLAALIAAHNKIGPDTVMLDYGCGIGRMAKELIARHGCRVIGVDISPSMRALSIEPLDIVIEPRPSRVTGLTVPPGNKSIVLPKPSRMLPLFLVVPAIPRALPLETSTFPSTLIIVLVCTTWLEPSNTRKAEPEVVTWIAPVPLVFNVPPVMMPASSVTIEPVLAAITPYWQCPQHCQRS
jgi:SAM-dependent methyltransferase